MVGSISISGISKHFVNPTGERITALDNVSLDIPAGSFVALIGPSGCGKSTLLRLISGLIPMDDGSLTLDGTPINAPGADRGFMFQEHTLFPWLSIYDNIAFGLRARGIYKQEKDRVDEFIEMVGSRASSIRIRTSFPAACASARLSQEHSLASPRCSCSMSRSVHSMPSPA